MSFWGLSQGVGTLAGTLARRPARRRPTGGGRSCCSPCVGVAATVAYLFTYDIRRGQSEPELAAVFAAGERVRVPDQPGRPAGDPRPAHQRVADPAGADRAGGVRLAGLAAAAVPGQGRGAGLRRRPPRSLIGSAVRHAVPARRGAVHRRRPGRRPAAAPHAARPGAGRRGRRPRRRAVLRGAVLRAAAIDVPDGAGAGAVIGPCWPACSPSRRSALSLLTALRRAGADLGQLAELVRAHRRRQPARAPRHRLQPGQPGQRRRPGGRQRRWSARCSARWPARSRRR